MDEISLGYLVLLVTTGFIAGIINTLAGGGSNLTIPALMIIGMPPEVANATNRVGIFMQSFVAVKEFKKFDMLQTGNLKEILIPVIIGGIFGALLAGYMPSWLLKPTLLGAMILMALIMLVKPSLITPDAGEKIFTIKEKPKSFYILFFAGFYGGFIQAGVGIILLAALAGSLRYDLVRANAIKMVCTLVFTAVALVIFIYLDQVRWIPGVILGAGTMVGAYLAVRLAIKVEPVVLKWFLFIMTVIASIAAMTVN